MSSDKLTAAREAAEETLGFRIPEVAGEPESYLPLLYESELTDHYMRLAINQKGEKLREQRMHEARHSGLSRIDL